MEIADIAPGFYIHATSTIIVEVWEKHGALVAWNYWDGEGPNKAKGDGWAVNKYMEKFIGPPATRLAKLLLGVK